MSYEAGRAYGYRRRESASGAKGRTRPENVDRTLPYKDWHREQARDLYVVDVDQLEVRSSAGKLYPAGVVELTFCPGGLDGYGYDGVPVLDAVWARLDPERDGNLQGYVLRGIANRLACPAFVSAFEVDEYGRLGRLAVRSLVERDEWRTMLPSEYANLLARLRK